MLHVRFITDQLIESTVIMSCIFTMAVHYTKAVTIVILNEQWSTEQQ